MKTTNENPIQPIEDQPAKPLYIGEQHNQNCQQFYGPVTGCVFAMPGANVYQTPYTTTPVPSANENATCNPQPCKDSIFQYVMRLHPAQVREQWQDKYLALWESILELPAVSSTIYDKGRQKDTTFNRNLVGNILHLLAERKVLKTGNATRLAIELEGSSEVSIRQKLGEMPVKKIKDSIEELI